MPVSVPPACSTRDRRMDRGSKERLHRHDEDRRQEQKRVERPDEEVLPCPRRDGRSLGAMLLDELLDRLLRAAAVEEGGGAEDRSLDRLGETEHGEHPPRVARAEADEAEDDEEEAATCPDDGSEDVQHEEPLVAADGNHAAGPWYGSADASTRKPRGRPATRGTWSLRKPTRCPAR